MAQGTVQYRQRRGRFDLMPAPYAVPGYGMVSCMDMLSELASLNLISSATSMFTAPLLLLQAVAKAQHAVAELANRSEQEVSWLLCYSSCSWTYARHERVAGRSFSRVPYDITCSPWTHNNLTEDRCRFNAGNCQPWR
jgi:hypothetical protein